MFINASKPIIIHSSNKTIDLESYHPDKWTHNGFPHDTFAVQFALKNDLLSVYLEILVVLFIIVIIFMAIFLIYMYVNHGGIQNAIDNDQKEYARLLKGIEKKHREARGEIGLKSDSDEDEKKKDK